MTKKSTFSTSVLNVVCAVLMLILLVLQFLPFWSYGDPSVSVSIQEYIWFPGDHTGLDKELTALVSADYSINDVLLMPILTLVLGAVGIVMCLFKSSNSRISLLPTACGLVGAFGYLTGAAFQVGSGWALHLVVCLLLVCAGLACLLSGRKTHA